MTPVRVLVAGHDWGGLNLLAPLLRQWTSPDSGIDVSFLGAPAVRREMSYRVAGLRLTLGTEGISDWTMERRDDLTAAVNAALDAETYDVILCGTSSHALLERILLAEGKKRKITTVAFCDMWWAYEERFRDGDAWRLPDRIWAIDAAMKAGIEAIDWPYPVAVDVVGSPLFGDQIARGAEHARDLAIRFISEPASTKFPASRIDEFAVAEAVVRCARRALPAMPIIIRPHPTDSAEAWRRWCFARRSDGVQFETLPLEEAIASTAYAVGISSMLLAQLQMSGSSVASFQMPGSDPAYYCLPFGDLKIATLHNEQELEAWFGSARPAVPTGIAALHSGAAKRATELILARPAGV